MGTGILAADSATKISATETFATDLFLRYGVAFLAALLVLAVGFPATQWLTRWIIRRWAARGLDPSLHHFLGEILLWTFRVCLFLMVGAMAGFQVTAFVALLGGFAFAVGLALQGHLSNFAGGILIILLRPFRVGDLVEAQGFTGRVSAIRVFNTILKTVDNRTIILPNGPLSNGSVVNFTMEAVRRVDVSVGVAYATDIGRAREVALRVLAADARVLREPPPEVVVTALADSSVNLSVRAWASTEAHPAVHAAIQEELKKAFEGADIEIPFPQRVVRILPEAGK